MWNFFLSIAKTNNTCWLTNLSGADLIGADLEGTDFSNADLSNTILNETNFQGANLRNAFLFSSQKPTWPAMRSYVGCSFPGSWNWPQARILAQPANWTCWESPDNSNFDIIKVENKGNLLNRIASKQRCCIFIMIIWIN